MDEEQPDSLPRLRFDTRVMLALFAALVFLLVAAAVAWGGLARFDGAVLTALRDTGDPTQPRGPGWLTIAMIDITALGDTTVLTLITTIATGLLVAAKRYRMAGLLALGVSLGALAITLLKEAVGRARPDLVQHLVEVSSLSFPSGHAGNSAIVFLTLAALAARATESRALRAYAIGAAAVLILLIGASRIYLGVHYPSDVLAGWTFGAAWALLMSLIADRLQREHRIEEPEGSGVA